MVFRHSKSLFNIAQIAEKIDVTMAVFQSRRHDHVLAIAKSVAI
jgi:hypothetical protein